MELKTLSLKPNNVQNLINLLYEESFEHIAMGCISINQIGDKWNTYVTSLNLGNLYADSMLVVSALLKKEFGINAIIFNEIKMRDESSIKNDAILILLSICIGSLFGYLIFLGGLINEKIKERKTNIKNLLYLSGSNSWSYWIAFFIIDYLKLSLFSLLLIIPIMVKIKYAGYAPCKAFYFLLNFLIVNASSLIFIYFISFFGSSPKSGIKFLFLFLIVFWIIFYMDFSLKLICKIGGLYLGNAKEIREIFYEYINGCFTIFDYTPITSMLLSFFRIFIEIFDLRENETQSYLSQSYIIQAINFVFYFLLLILMETGYLRNFLNWFKLKFILSRNNYVFFENKFPDEFLLNEVNTTKLNRPLIQDENKDHIIKDSNEYTINRISLSETNLNNNIIKGNPDVNNEKYMLDKRNDFTTSIEGLYKTFWLCCRKNVRAINNLNLGLEANEKFGLLGLNGSGKTTTFKAITNEILYDYGKISSFGFDTKKEFKKIRAKIGYCPQENPLFDFMKVREILEFYSKLKTCFFPIEEICKKFDLTKYLDTYCVNLSGGNKRKLTFVIAIMNRPTLLLLDEPSTGVDPDSRRFMWKNINELSESGHRYNMILTTHSMEEAEILCDRVGWLKQGSFACIGNPEKLKIQCSLGYKLHIKFDEHLINKDNLKINIRESFETISGLIDGFNNYSNYIMNNPTLEPNIIALIDVIKKIKPNKKSIILAEIRKDLSFELILNIMQEKKHILFSDILNIKNNDKNISEIIISMESLENILSSFI